MRAMYRQSDMPNPTTNGHFDAHVYQATGMVSAQLDCDVAEAFALLKFHAAATGEGLEVVALAVVDGTLRFDE